MKHKIASKIVVLSVLMALIFSAAGASPAQAAGIYTHSIFVEHAIEKLNAHGGYSELVDILNRYPDVVNYGATFPDTTYAGIDDDWAEMLHDTGTVNSNYAKFLQFLADKGYAYNWDLQAGYYKQFLADPDYTSKLPEFRAALMAQILDHFNNNPRSADDEKMIAFLFGVIAHQEADSPWHLNCSDPNWRGLECAAGADLGLDEYKLEMTAKFFDGFHSVNFSYVDSVYDTVLAASDAIGARRPDCHATCVAYPGDPIRTGNFNLSAFWTEPGIPPGWPWQWGGFNDWIYNHVPGGIYDGSSLVAGAWMQAWDKLDSTNIYYVKPAASGNGNCSSWDNACTLQSALSQAVNGEIWLAAGTHKPTDATDRNATFRLKASVAVYGGFAGMETVRDQRDPLLNVTILSGDIDSNDINSDGNNIAETSADIRGNNSYHVVTGATGATLDGLYITAGSATGAGGGMLNDGSSPTVRNVIFSGNLASYNGGGIANYGGTPAITNVTFIGNSAASSGGGMSNAYGGNPTVTNVTFIGNWSYFGGGMSNFESAPVITNATFSGNRATHRGGAISNNYQGSPVIRNSILWNNTAANGDAQIYSDVYSAHPVLDNNVVQGGYTGGTNIFTGDPLLGTLGYYGGFTPTIQLLEGSSAVDTGQTGYCPETDQRGVERPQGSGCDIGAFERNDFTIPSLTSFTRQNPAASSTNADTLVFRAAFSEDVQSVDAADFAVNGTTTATVTLVTPISASEYDITVSGGDLASFNGMVGLDLAAGQNITDLGGNPLPADEPGTDETYLVDNTEPSLTVPSNMTVEATSAAGAVVNFVATATDNFDATPSINCAPASGSTFPFGTATVNCSATDDAGNAASDSFTVTVIHTPGNIAIDNTDVDENLAAGTLVGNLSTIDFNPADTFTYTLVPGTGDADNASFTISGSQLLTSASFDFEAQSSYSIRVRTTESSGGWVERVFTITINDVNEVPVTLNLSNSSVAGNMLVGTVVGNFSTVDPDAGDTFTYTLVPGTGSTDNASFTISGGELRTAAVFNFALKNSYAIRVRTTDSGGLWLEQTFTINVTANNYVPAIITPANGEHLLTNRPDFDWTDVPGARFYQWQVSRFANFSVLHSYTTTIASQHTPARELFFPEQLYWRVRAYGPWGYGPWTTASTFYTANAPRTPALVSPAINALTRDYTPRLDWALTFLPVGTTLDYYQVQVATDAAFSAPVINERVYGLANSEYTPTTDLNPNTKYYWRVRAFNTAGEYSGWSLTRTFRTTIATPILTMPVNGSTTANRRPTFDWDDTSGATLYTIQVSRNSTFTSLVFSVNVTNSTFTPLVNLPLGTLYWRVRAYGANGPSLWSSPVWSFTITP
jgi:hypothetical protein